MAMDQMAVNLCSHLTIPTLRMPQYTAGPFKLSADS